MLIGLTQQGTRFRCLSQLILAVPAIESGVKLIHKGEAEVCIHLSSPHAPIVIDAAGRSDFALVVPVRLKEEMAA